MQLNRALIKEQEFCPWEVWRKKTSCERNWKRSIYITCFIGLVCSFIVNWLCKLCKERPQGRFHISKDFVAILHSTSCIFSCIPTTCCKLSRGKSLFQKLRGEILSKESLVVDTGCVSVIKNTCQESFAVIYVGPLSTHKCSKTVKESLACSTTNETLLRSSKKTYQTKLIWEVQGLLRRE